MVPEVGLWSLIVSFPNFPHLLLEYSKTCVKRPRSKRPKIVFQDHLSLNAGQKYCRMLQGEHSAILSTFIKLLFVIKLLFCLILSVVFHMFYCNMITLFFYLPDCGVPSIVASSFFRPSILANVSGVPAFSMMFIELLVSGRDSPRYCLSC